MTNYVTDPFTDTAGVDLPSHSPTLGGPWAYHTSNTGAFVVTNANRIRQNAAGNCYAYAAGVPGSADYDVTTVLRKLGGVIGTAANLGIWGRLLTAALTGYYVHYNDGAAQWQLGRVVAGGNATLGTFAQALTLNQDYTVVLRMQGTAITAFIDGVARIGPITDANIAGVGLGGVKASGNVAVATDTTGYHLDSLSVDSIPVAGVAANRKDGAGIGASGLWVPNMKETRIMVPE